MSEKTFSWNGGAALSRSLVAALLLVTFGSGSVSALYWQIETVDPAIDAQDPSLALDSAGRPHISYYDNINGDLKHAAYDGLTWWNETVDSEQDVGLFPSLVLDNAGFPRIGYYDSTNGDLKYAAFDGREWDIRAVDSAGDVGFDPSLALGADGYPRISYFHTTNANLKYAAYDGSTWWSETVDPVWGVGSSSSLALDGDGFPCVGYYDYQNDDLKFAYYDGREWNIGTVDSAGDVGVFPSLALDSTGNPHLSYYDYTNGDLKFAHFLPPYGWLTETVAATVVGRTSLALDSAGHPHIVYGDGSGALTYTAWDPLEGWSTETVDSSGVSWACSLALDGADNPRISYTLDSDGSNNVLKYAVGGAVQPPAVTAVTPNTGTRGFFKGILIDGAGFQDGATVKLNRTGSPDIPGTYVSVYSPTQIWCQIDLYSAATGAWDVIVTNPDGQTAMLPNGFTVTEPTLSITSITPNFGTAGTPVAVTITGTGFLPGATVSLSGYGPEKPASNVIVVSPTTITCRLDLPADAEPQLYTVSVTNTNGEYAIMDDGFAINSPSIAISSILPNTGARGSTVSVLNLAGSGFAEGARVYLVRYGVYIEAYSVSLTPSRITCQFVLPADAAVGSWSVMVRNPEFKDAYLPGGFTITDPPGLAVTAISPSSGIYGETIQVEITGTGFQEGAIAKLNSNELYVPREVTATDITVISPTKITCTFLLPSGVTTYWLVQVTNPDGGVTVSPSYMFFILGPNTPTITSITPNSGGQGTTVAITDLAGTGFVAGATVKLTKTGCEDIVAASVTAPSPTKIICQFVIPATAAIGAWNVTVTNPAGQGATLQDGFTVTAPPSLTVTSITPFSGRRGSTVAITDLAGTGFVPGATVRLTGYGEIAATNVVVVSPTRITCTFVLPYWAALDPWNVVITNPDDTSATLTNSFTVLPEEPPSHTVTGITPEQGTAGTTVTATIDGTRFGFGAPAYVWLQRGTDTIMATSVVVVSTVQITCQFALPSTAATGAWDVAVQTVGEIGYLRSGFTITAPVQPLPGGTGVPADTDKDGKYDDVNGNARKDFADVVLYFNQMSWIAGNEPVSAFDYNSNARIDFADVVWLFNRL